MRRESIFAAGIQESWRLGSNIFDNRGLLIVQHGNARKNRKNGRVSGGVAIVLSPEAKRAFVAAGSQVLNFGERILAVRLKLVDAKKRTVNILFVSAYFPVGAASPTIRQEFYLELERCIASCSENEILLIGADCNSSMGTRSAARDAVLGPFGLPHRNKAGTGLYEFCSKMGLCSVTSSETTIPKIGRAHV